MEIVNKKSSNLMTKFEVARLVGLRALQISNGSPLMINQDLVKPEWGYLDIAMEELKQRRLPMILKRTFANGDYELWKVEEMIIDIDP